MEISGLENRGNEIWGLVAKHGIEPHIREKLWVKWYILGSLVVLFAVRNILSCVLYRSGASARPFHKTYVEHVEQVRHPLSKTDVELNVGR